MQQPLINRIAPFILLGIAIVAFVLGMVLLAYILIFGALVGMALFVISWIKTKFFQPKKPVKRIGRTIDHE